MSEIFSRKEWKLKDVDLLNYIFIYLNEVYLELEFL